MELLGNKIQMLRKNKNLSQQELAEKLSVSSQAVSKWERNLSSPDISMPPVMARFLVSPWTNYSIIGWML